MTKAQEREQRRKAWRDAVYEGRCVSYGRTEYLTTVMHKTHVDACRAVVEANDPERVRIVMPARRKVRNAKAPNPT